ncbi:collagenase-like [Chironomus tepperi]|uniref:collagenase-like n=1 Tax=Chironomus tepperi TaxID=113505 RepID=UPI00391FAAA9
MKIYTIALIYLIPTIFCESFIPDDWISAQSPLTSTIYKDITSKIPGINRHARITRGKTAKLGQIPHQVLLYTTEEASSHTYLCGGSIISSNWILTAAHCIYKMSNATVYAGIIDRILGPAEWTASISKSQLVPHELYSPDSTLNDIGLVGAVNITFGPYVQKISIPTVKDAVTSLIRRLGDISGWGVTSYIGLAAQDLQYAQGPIVDNFMCVGYFGTDNVKDSHVCLDTRTGRSTCNGDSGGPLSVTISSRQVLVGIVSFGSAYGCELGIPAVFTRVSSHLDWIKGKTGLIN